MMDQKVSGSWGAPHEPNPVSMKNPFLTTKLQQRAEKSIIFATFERSFQL